MSPTIAGMMPAHSPVLALPPQPPPHFVDSRRESDSRPRIHVNGATSANVRHYVNGSSFVSCGSDLLADTQFAGGELSSAGNLHTQPPSEYEHFLRAEDIVSTAPTSPEVATVLEDVQRSTSQLAQEPYLRGLFCRHHCLPMDPSRPLSLTVKNLERYILLDGRSVSIDEAMLQVPLPRCVHVSSLFVAYPLAPAVQGTTEARVPDIVQEKPVSEGSPPSGPLFSGACSDLELAYFARKNTITLWHWSAHGEHTKNFSLPGDVNCLGVVRPKPSQLSPCDAPFVLIAAHSGKMIELFGLRGEHHESTGLPEMFPTEHRITTKALVTAVVGHSASGRIFYGDSCGSVYEFEYDLPAVKPSTAQSLLSKLPRYCVSTTVQSEVCRSTPLKEASMFSKPFAGLSGAAITRMAVDEDRGLLYALTETGDIHVFAIPPPSVTTADLVQDHPSRFLLTLTKSTMMEQIRRHGTAHCAAAEKAFKVAALVPLAIAISDRICLCLVLKNGYRLFLQASPQPPGSGHPPVLLDTDLPDILARQKIGSMNLVNIAPPPEPLGSDAVSLVTAGVAGGQRALLLFSELGDGVTSAMCMSADGGTMARRQSRHTSRQTQLGIAKDDEKESLDWYSVLTGRIEGRPLLVSELPVAPLYREYLETRCELPSPFDGVQRAADAVARKIMGVEPPRSSRKGDSTRSLRTADLAPFAADQVAPPPQFLVVTSSGVYIMLRRRPMDQFKMLHETPRQEAASGEDLQDSWFGDPAKTCRVMSPEEFSAMLWQTMVFSRMGPDGGDDLKGEVCSAESTPTPPQTAFGRAHLAGQNADAHKLHPSRVLATPMPGSGSPVSYRLNAVKPSEAPITNAHKKAFDLLLAFPEIEQRAFSSVVRMDHQLPLSVSNPFVGRNPMRRTARHIEAQPTPAESSRVAGLMLYMARILRPFWSSPAFVPVVAEGPLANVILLRPAAAPLGQDHPEMRELPNTPTPSRKRPAEDRQGPAEKAQGGSGAAAAPAVTMLPRFSPAEFHKTRYWLLQLEKTLEKVILQLSAGAGHKEEVVRLQDVWLMVQTSRAVLAFLSLLSEEDPAASTPRILDQPMFNFLAGVTLRDALVEGSTRAGLHRLMHLINNVNLLKESCLWLISAEHYVLYVGLQPLVSMRKHIQRTRGIEPTAFCYPLPFYATKMTTGVQAAIHLLVRKASLVELEPIFELLTDLHLFETMIDVTMAHAVSLMNAWNAQPAQLLALDVASPEIQQITDNLYVRSFAPLLNFLSRLRDIHVASQGEIPSVDIALEVLNVAIMHQSRTQIEECVLRSLHFALFTWIAAEGDRVFPVRLGDIFDGRPQTQAEAQLTSSRYYLPWLAANETLFQQRGSDLLGRQLIANNRLLDAAVFYFDRATEPWPTIADPESQHFQSTEQNRLPPKDMSAEEVQERLRDHEVLSIRAHAFHPRIFGHWSTEDAAIAMGAVAEMQQTPRGGAPSRPTSRQEARTGLWVPEFLNRFMSSLRPSSTDTREARLTLPIPEPPPAVPALNASPRTWPTATTGLSAATYHRTPHSSGRLVGSDLRIERMRPLSDLWVRICEYVVDTRVSEGGWIGLAERRQYLIRAIDVLDQFEESAAGGSNVNGTAEVYLPYIVQARREQVEESLRAQELRKNARHALAIVELQMALLRETVELCAILSQTSPTLAEAFSKNAATRMEALAVLEKEARPVRYKGAQYLHDLVFILQAKVFTSCAEAIECILHFLLYTSNHAPWPGLAAIHCIMSCPEETWSDLPALQQLGERLPKEARPGLLTSSSQISNLGRVMQSLMTSALKVRRLLALNLDSPGLLDDMVERCLWILVMSFIKAAATLSPLFQLALTMDESIHGNEMDDPKTLTHLFAREILLGLHAYVDDRNMHSDMMSLPLEWVVDAIKRHFTFFVFPPIDVSRQNVFPLCKALAAVGCLLLFADQYLQSPASDEARRSMGLFLTVGESAVLAGALLEEANRILRKIAVGFLTPLTVQPFLNSLDRTENAVDVDAALVSEMRTIFDDMTSECYKTLFSVGRFDIRT